MDGVFYISQNSNVETWLPTAHDGYIWGWRREDEWSFKGGASVCVGKDLGPHSICHAQVPLHSTLHAVAEPLLAAHVTSTCWTRLHAISPARHQLPEGTRVERKKWVFYLQYRKHRFERHYALHKDPYILPPHLNLSLWIIFTVHDYIFRNSDPIQGFAVSEIVFRKKIKS